MWHVRARICTLRRAGSQKENADHTPHLRNRYAICTRIPKMAITHGNVQKWMYRISCLRSAHCLPNWKMQQQCSSSSSSLVPLHVPRRTFLALCVCATSSGGAICFPHPQWLNIAKCSKSPHIQVPYYSYSLALPSLSPSPCASSRPTVISEVRASAVRACVCALPRATCAWPN